MIQNYNCFSNIFPVLLEAEGSMVYLNNINLTEYKIFEMIGEINYFD